MPSLSFSLPPVCRLFFFFNDTATTEIYTLSLHDALPISAGSLKPWEGQAKIPGTFQDGTSNTIMVAEKYGDCYRSEEHTSELQSPCNLVCRLLLEKKKECTLRQLLARRASSRPCGGPPPT